MISLLAESWTWYAFVVLIAAVRYVSRYVQLGSIKRFQTEDYVMIIVLVWYTVLIVCMNIVSQLNTNLMLPGEELTLTPESITSRIRGSKLVLVVEQSMILTIWGCKACLLLMYNKLTFGLKQHLAVKIVAGYVAVTFLAMEILYLGVWCRPINKYWSVPVDNVQCSAAVNHLITNAVFNISSDIMMLCIPLPLLIVSQLPRAKKFVLCGLFGLGIFVILSAILNKYYSFAQPFSPMWTFWYIREASVAILIANVPNCWPLFRKVFHLRSFHHNGSTGNTQSRTTNTQGLPITASRTRKTVGSVNLSTIAKSKDKTEAKSQMSWWEREAGHGGMSSRLGRTESEERMVRSPGPAKLMPLEIWESKEYDVDRGSVRQAGFETRTTITASAPSAGRRSESSSRERTMTR